MTPLTAIQIAIALSRAITNLSEHLGRVGNVIEQANSEGRDLTDAEIEDIQAAREAAVNAWQDAGGDQT